MTRVESVGRSLGAHRYPQQQLTDAFARATGLDDSRKQLLARLHRNCGVQYRNLALPIEQYPLGDFGVSNEAFIEIACDLAITAAQRALREANVSAEAVDVVLCASTTGLAVPSLEARIAPQLGLRSDVKRIPLVGLGCAAGAAALGRGHDFLCGAPNQTALVICVELCSLTFQPQDASVANLIGSGLFGDGAAAALLTSDDQTAEPDVATGVSADSDEASHRNPACRPQVLATRSRLYPDTQRMMGWDVSGSGLQLVLGAEIPALIKSTIAYDVDQFLAGQGLTRSDIAWWVCHPGGPKVLEALQDALELCSATFQRTWDSLAEIGNISSASVLHILADAISRSPPDAGTHGLLLALGPGFSLDMVLLEA